ncbi:MAG: pentapeptide repeat-containing protein [Candidatus Nanopelagicales bacterium]
MLFREVDMTSLTSSGATFAGCVFRDCTLSASAHTSRGAFLGCAFVRTRLVGARFVGCKLTGSWFEACALDGVVVDGGD